MPRIKIDEAKGELQALRQKREQLLPTIAETEEVRAPMSGVVSVSNVVPGQIVDAREVLFEIVDPTRFWVEAIAHDASVAANLSSAVAITDSGERLPLEFAGARPHAEAAGGATDLPAGEGDRRTSASASR